MNFNKIRVVVNIDGDISLIILYIFYNLNLNQFILDFIFFIRVIVFIFYKNRKEQEFLQRIEYNLFGGEQQVFRIDCGLYISLFFVNVIFFCYKYFFVKFDFLECL